MDSGGLDSRQSGRGVGWRWGGTGGGRGTGGAMTSQGKQKVPESWLSLWSPTGTPDVEGVLWGGGAGLLQCCLG